MGVSIGCVTQAHAFIAGETGLLMHSRNERFDGTSRLILYSHGFGSTEREPFTYKSAGPSLGQPASTIPQYLAADGYIVYAGLWGSTSNYGNDLCLARMEAAAAAMRALGASADPLGLLGVSMGNMSNARYWAAHEADVDAVVGLVPLCNAINGYNDAAAGTKAAMNAAWGGNFLVNGALFSPHNLVPTIDDAGEKLRLHYSTTDNVVRPADALALAAAVGATALPVDGVGFLSGHSSWAAPQQPHDLIRLHYRERLVA